MNGRHVLVLVESPPGVAAVDAGIDHARVAGGRLTLLHLVDTRVLWMSAGFVEDPPSGAIDHAADYGSRLLRRAADRVPPEVPVTTQLLVRAQRRHHQLRGVLVAGVYDVLVAESAALAARRWRRRVAVVAALAGVPLVADDAGIHAAHLPSSTAIS